MTTKIATREEEHQLMKEKAEAFLDMADKLYIDNTTQADECEVRNKEQYASMKHYKTYLEEDKASVYAPYKRILDKIKTIIGPMEKGTKLVTNKIGAFRKRHNDRIEAEQKKLESKAMKEQKKTGELVIPEQTGELKVPAANGTTRMRIKSIDFDKIERRYLIPPQTKKTLVDAMTKMVEDKMNAMGLKKIKGVVAEEETTFRRS